MDMTEQDYELLSRYLDHELSLPASRELEQRLAAEPVLQAALQQLQASDQKLKSTFHAAELQSIPPRVAAMLEQTPSNVVFMPQKRFAQKRTATWGFALAASLVVATSAVLLSQHNQDLNGISSTDPMLAASLEQASSRGDGWDTLVDGRQFRSVLSFRSTTGHWCREYLLSAEQSNWHGVACRKDNAWITEVQVAATINDSSDQYRPAGAADSNQIANFIDGQAADIALDLNQEAALIARQWQQ